MEDKMENKLCPYCEEPLRSKIAGDEIYDYCEMCEHIYG